MSIIGLVMCGGQSTRMGQDKGMLVQNEKTWAELTSEKINALETCNKVYISINQKQLPAYSQIFDYKSLILDSIDISGPLCGLLSAHKNFPENDFLIVACDMQKVDKVILKMPAFSDYTKYDAVVFQHPAGEYEPLLGIYSAHFLARIYSEFETGILYRFSMKSILEKANVLAIKINPEEEVYFSNYNSPEDLL